MRKMLYLDTTIPSYLFDERERTEKGAKPNNVPVL